MPRGIYIRIEGKKYWGSNKGKHWKLSKKTKYKMSKAKKGNTPWNKNKHLSEEHKRRIGLNGFHYGMLGKKQSREHIEKRVSQFRGNKNHFWKGGITKDWAYYSRQRRNRKLKANGSHTIYEWLNLKAQYNWTCPCCKKAEPEIKLTEDHIIPLSKGGSDNIENIQPLCRNCNSKKNIKIIKYEQST